MRGLPEFFPCELCLLALGFLGPENAVLEQLGVEQDPRSNIKTPAGKYATNVPGVFAAGDCRRGQSLVVWGIQEGRAAAVEVDAHLMRETRLPWAGSIPKRNLYLQPPFHPELQAQTQA